MIVKFNAFNANSRGKNQDGQLSIKKPFEVLLYNTQ